MPSRIPVSSKLTRLQSYLAAAYNNIRSLLDLIMISELDKALLQERFQQLKPDNNGFIEKAIFDVEEYSDPFCKQVLIILLLFVATVFFYRSTCRSG